MIYEIIFKVFNIEECVECQKFLFSKDYSFKYLKKPQEILVFEKDDDFPFLIMVDEEGYIFWTNCKKEFKSIDWKVYKRKEKLCKLK